MKPLKENQIGIMSVVHEGRPPFGLQTYFFEDMVKSVNIDPKVMFFFSLLEWEEGKERVSGFNFIDNKWVETEDKLPEIIYDRAFSKEEKDKHKLERIRNYLTSRKKKILNPLKLTNLLNDKVKFHEFLLSNKIATLQYFPFSKLTDVDFLENLNTKSVYVKPIYGSKGEGIYKIEKEDEEMFLLHHGNLVTPFDSYPPLLGLLLDEIPDQDRYFVQEEAQIQKHENAPFDIRVLVQNYGNEYAVTGKAVRIGRKYSITSNLNSGGYALPIEELEKFFHLNYEYSLKEIHEKIEDLCLSCCNVLKDEFGDFCEIGFDVLITKDRGPIILEANAKPSRWVFVKIADYLESIEKDNSYYLDRRKETVSVPMKYAEFLLSNQ